VAGMDRTLRLAVIGGDGIGPEVVAEAVKVLGAAVAGSGHVLDCTDYDLGAARWLRTGEALPDSVLAELRGHDALLLGAVGAAPGDRTIPSGVLERGLLLRVRFTFDQYVNLRPARLWPGVSGPLDASVRAGGIDLVVVREGTEGPYLGNGGVLRAGTDAEVATEVSVNTAFGVRRVVRDAFARAAARPRRRLTLLHKHNVLTYAGGLWRRIVDEEALAHPEVSVDYSHIDAAMIHLVTDPGRFDVIVTDNLFGDVVTDLTAAVTGGIGLAASANINPERTAPSMFEPVHGSAPDIAGQGLADPTAAVLSTVLLSEHLGLPEVAARIQAAVVADLAGRVHGARRSTSQIGDALAQAATG